MIAITGASGQLGRLVIENLLQHSDANNVVALARNPESIADLAARGVTVRQADYDQPETLAPALAGVDKLLLISSSAIGQRVPQHQAVIDAAKAAGVTLLAYTSILRADSSSLALAAEHKATEAAIAESGLPAVLLRNGWYNENYTQSLPMVMQTGTVISAAAEGRIASATRQDYADAAANVMISPESQAGKIYELAGDKAFTLAEYAAEIAAQSGESVQYQALDGATFAAALAGAGLPEALAGLLADTEVEAAKGGLFDNSNSLSQLIGRATTPISESIRLALAQR